MALIQTESDHDAVAEAIRSGLVAYNDRFLPVDRASKPLAVSLKENSRIVGGITGRWSLEWMAIDLFWIDDSFRGLGHGTRLITQFEDEARQLGVRYSYLDTFGFQAQGFYEKIGYREFGRLEKFAGEFDRIWMRKDL